ncbi:hypothetical protein Gpo141_00013616 [Globisporangium polare]
MANFMKKAFTNDNWSKVADNYERTAEGFMVHWVSNALLLAHQRIEKAVSSETSAEPVTFLDVGCGTGALCLAFAEKYLSSPPSSDIQIIATDLADGMIARVDEKLDTRPRYQYLRPQITTMQMDGQLLDKLSDASVDVLGSNYGITIFPDRVKAFGSAMRVLKPEGVFFATVWDAQSPNMRWVDGCARLAHEAQQRKKNGPDSEVGPPPFLPSAKVGHASIIAELQAAGFRDIEMFRSQHAVVLETASAFVASMLGNPGFSGFIESAGREKLEDFLYQSVVDEGDFAVGSDDHQQQGQKKKPSSVQELKNLTRPVTINFIGHVIVATK